MIRPVLLLGEDFRANLAAEAVGENFAEFPEIFILRPVARRSRHAAADFSVDLQLRNEGKAELTRAARDGSWNVVCAVQMDVEPFLGGVNHVGTFVAVRAGKLVRVQMDRLDVPVQIHFVLRAESAVVADEEFDAGGFGVECRLVLQQVIFVAERFRADLWKDGRLER